METHVSCTSRAPRTGSRTRVSTHQKPNPHTLATAPGVTAGPAGSPFILVMPFKGGPREGTAIPLPGGGLLGGLGRGERGVAGPYLQRSPWPAAGRSACPPGAMPAPSIPSPAPHGTLLQRPPPAATGWSRAMEDVQEHPSASPRDGGCAGASFALAAPRDRGEEPSRSPRAPLRGSYPTQNCPPAGPTAGLLGLQEASPRRSPVTAALRGLAWL